MPDANTIDRLDCPYSQCGVCQYVGVEIRPDSTCPGCGHASANAIGVWPQVQWFSATADIVFLADNKKLELLTITIAAYYEGILFSFLDQAFMYLYPETRTPDKEKFDSVAGGLDRWEAELRDYRQRRARIDQFMTKHRTWFGRHERLCKLLFDTSFDDLLSRHHDVGAAHFIDHRDKIHYWRNVLLHRGVPLDEIWPKEVCAAIPAIALGFVRECWNAFRDISNGALHCPYWSSHRESAQESKSA